MRNVKWNYAHRGIFKNKSNIYDGAFFTSVKPYSKNVLNLIVLPLSSIFYTTHPFHEKTYNSENFGRKSLLFTMERNSKISKFEIMQWNGAINKQKQLPEVFYRKRCFYKFCKIHRKTLVPESLFIIKETLAQVFSCEFCEISWNTFFTEHLWATASE